MRKLFIILGCFFFLACHSDEGAKIGTKAPFISAKEGKKIVKIKDFSGKVVVVFIQDGCAFCLKNLPLLDSYASTHKIKVFAIDSISKDFAFKKMVAKLGLKHIIFMQDNLNLSWTKYSIFAVPTMIIIDNNIIKARIIGDKKWPFIQKILAKS